MVMTALPRADSITTPQKLRQVSALNTTAARISACKAATAAASVGREGARIDASQQHDGHGQRQCAAEYQACPLRAGHGLIPRHVAFDGDDMHHHHHQRSHQESGHNTTQKQGAHRGA